MRVPDNTLYTSRIRAYGTAGMPVDDLEEQAGCPALYRAKYVDFKIQEPRSYPMDYGGLIHDALFLMEHEGLPLLPDALEKAWSRLEMPLGPDAWVEATNDLTKYMERPDDGLATLAVEQHLTMPLMEYKGEQYFYGGYVDKIAFDPHELDALDDDDDAWLTLYVDDYKTVRRPPSKTDVDTDPQFTGYMLLVLRNLARWLPDVEPERVRVVGRMDAIKWYRLETLRESWQLEAFEDFCRAMVRMIVDDEEGNPVLNEGCNYCPVKFDCSEFRKLPGQGKTLMDRMSTSTDLQQRVFLMQQAQLVQKGVKAIIEQVQGELKEAARSEPDGLVFNGVRYGLGDQFDTDWDLAKLHEIMGMDFYGVVSPTGYKVEDWVERHLESKEDVEACRVKVPKSTFRLTAKKEKGV